MSLSEAGSDLQMAQFASKRAAGAKFLRCFVQNQQRLKGPVCRIYGNISEETEYNIQDGLYLY